jgi:hypothetical protein
VLVAGNAVEDPLAEIDPGREETLVEPRIAGRRREVEDLLPGDAEEALADHIGEQAAHPGTAGEDVEVRFEDRAVRELQTVHPSLLQGAGHGGPEADLPPFRIDSRRHGLAGTPGQEIAGLPFQEDGADSREVNLGELFPGILDGDLGHGQARVLQIGE